MKQAELLRKQADMIEMAEKYGIDDWRKLVMVEVQTPNGDTRYETLVSKMYMSFSESNPKFALGVVEGCPVFEDDKLFSKDGTMVVAKYFERNCLIVSIDTDKQNYAYSLEFLSWNPPKPKTVSIEISVEDAEFMASNIFSNDNGSTGNIHIVCCNALKQLEQ